MLGEANNTGVPLKEGIPGETVGCIACLLGVLLEEGIPLENSTSEPIKCGRGF